MLIPTLEQINSQYEEIVKRLSSSCECAKFLVLRRRRISQSDHYVKQCSKCGRQVGNAVSKASVVERLSKGKILGFDESICTIRAADDSILYKELSVLSSMKHDYELGRVPNPTVELSRYAQEQIEESSNFGNYVNSLSSRLGDGQVSRMLIDQYIRLVSLKRNEALLSPDRFKSEIELKAWFQNHMMCDFDFQEEAKGRHISEPVNVRIDFMVKAKPHLLNLGFDPAPFGVEVKYLPQEDSFLGKASAAVWQSISYNYCEFSSFGKTFRPKYVLIFSNLSFESEMNLLQTASSGYDNDRSEWRGLCHVANHARVGFLKIRGSRFNHLGWRIDFAGASYFYKSLNGEVMDYVKGNPNVINKLRIGNFY
jgi:hypothetical protein